MKKGMALVFALFMLVTTSFSQTKKVAKKEVSKVQTTKVVLKKDGTPDKRFKQSTKTTVVLKKDGTPDKRYKAAKKQ